MLDTRDKEYVEESIGNKYKEWKTGDNIMILAGTGKGKSHFVKTVLNRHCRNTKKRILLLTNREILKKQTKKDIGLNTIITVLNYQKIESLLLKNVSLKNYDYIVMDECHYFFTDSAFNIKTDLFFKWMLNNTSVCKIFMTATPNNILSYFKQHNIHINYKYELKTDYSYLSSIYAFNDYDTIDGIIEDIPQDEQILFISRSAKRAYEISKKYNGAFICSKYNDEFSKYNNEEELDNIIKKSEFKSHLLCSTTVLDNGINLKEFSSIKHIILDIFDRDTFIQCLGRKRVGKGETVTLYFKNYNGKQINGFKSKIVHGLKLADTLLELGEEKYIKMSFKNDIFYKYNSKVIDEIWDDAKGISKKVINECMYHKYQNDLGICNAILNNPDKFNFKDLISHGLDIKKGRIIDMEVVTKILSTEEMLESITEKRLFKEEQKQLIEFIGLKDARGRKQKSLEMLNPYLKTNRLPYIIISKQIKTNNKRTTIWKVEKLIE